MIIQPNETLTLKAGFTVAGVPAAVTPAPTVTLIDPDGVETTDGTALLQNGAGAYPVYAYTFTSPDEGTWIVVFSTTDVNVDAGTLQAVVVVSADTSVQAGLTAQGYTTARAELLDNLDEPVSGVGGGGGGATVEEIWAAVPQGKITVTSAVEALTGNITIVRGDTYAEAQARGLRWSSADWTNWNLATAAIVFKAKSKLSRSIFTTAVTDVNTTTVQLELTSAETAAFALDDYRFDIEATLANGEVHTLVQGTMRVRADVR